MITMALGGFWQGANWTFLFWGILHGAYLVVNHIASALFARLGLAARAWWRVAAGWLITLLAVVFFWVLFRADTLPQAFGSWRSMVDVGSALNLVGQSAFPHLKVDLLWDGLRDMAPLLATAIPLGVYNFTEAMTNVESAATAGDRYNLRSVLLADGAGAVVGSALGYILHRDPDTYRYIPESIRRYPGARGVADRLDSLGFDRITVIPLLFGLMSLHVANRSR